MNGTSRILRAFETERKAALMPYFTIRFPDFETSLDIIAACCHAGADLMELGMPFSDPLADGPTIQHSTQVALQNGTNLKSCLEAVSALRGRGIRKPFLLMGYINPVLSFGLSAFVDAASAAGVDGFILPDLPTDEAGDFSALCAEAGLSLVYLLAPNSTSERTRLALEHTSSFLYLVSVTGTTGARETLPAELAGFISRVREASGGKTRLAVGFGIGNREQAGAVASLADGVIVGSALIKTVDTAHSTGKDPVAAAAKMIGALRAATE